MGHLLYAFAQCVLLILNRSFLQSSSSNRSGQCLMAGIQDIRVIKKTTQLEMLQCIEGWSVRPGVRYIVCLSHSTHTSTHRHATQPVSMLMLYSEHVQAMHSNVTTPRKHNVLEKEEISYHRTRYDRNNMHMPTAQTHLKIATQTVSVS